MDKKEKEAIKKQKAFFNRISKVLTNFINKQWVLNFEFTKHNGVLDACGIDIIICFSCIINGKVGKLLAQQKPTTAKAKGHLIKYPRVPVYILKYDTANMIGYVLTTLLLECDAYNPGKRIEIECEQERLKAKVLNPMNPAQLHRVFLTKEDYEKKTGKKI